MELYLKLIDVIFPVFFIIGVGYYRLKIDSKQISGVIIGLIGSVILMYQGSVINPDQNILYVFFIILSSILYATSLNILKVHLQDVSAVAITVGNFIFIFPLALIVFLNSDYKQIDLSSLETKNAIFYILLLSVFGTVFAKILFNKFVQIFTFIIVPFLKNKIYLFTILKIIANTKP